MVVGPGPGYDEEVEFNWKSGNTTLYIIGKVTYKDVYNKTHYTSFFLWYNPIENHFFSCTSNNYSD